LECSTELLRDLPIYSNWLLTDWQKKKTFIVVIGIMQVLNSSIGSSLPAGAIGYIANDFYVTDRSALVLPISAYIIGYVVGPLFFGPLSEAYGRKLPLLVSFAMFNVFMLACALATSFTSLLVFRLFSGIVAGTPIAVAGGLLADVYSDPAERGRTMAYLIAVSVKPPSFATNCEECQHSHI
jgi:MFS family permease